MPVQTPSIEERKSVKPLWHRKLASVSRWLHIYLSMVSFGVVIFFSATGITLNHQDKFLAQQQVKQLKGQLTSRLVSGKDVVKLEVVEYLRNTHGIHGAVADFRIEEDRCSVSFKGPGYAADSFIDRKTGTYELTETRMGFIAVINDLHKGRDSGKAWAWVIDLSAIFLVLVSISGVLILCYLYKRRFTGFAAGVAGILITYLAYVIWVP